MLSPMIIMFLYFVRCHSPGLQALQSREPLMEHHLHIAQCNAFLSESDKNTCQSVGQIGSMQKVVVKRSSLTLCATVKSNSYLLWFLQVVHPVMWYVPGWHTVELFCRDFLRVTMLYELVHERFVVSEIFLV